MRAWIVVGRQRRVRWVPKSAITALRPVLDGFARPNGFGFLLKLDSLLPVPSSSSVATPFGPGSWAQGPEVGPIPTPREGEHSARTASTPAAWNTRLCAMGCSGDLTTHLFLAANSTSQFACLCTLPTVRALEPGYLYIPFQGGSRGDTVESGIAPKGMYKFSGFQTAPTSLFPSYARFLHHHPPYPTPTTPPISRPPADPPRQEAPHDTQ